MLEVHEPYATYPVGHASYPALPEHYGGLNNYGAGEINADQVLAVQPVALKPVGSPIQAVPLGPVGNAGTGVNLGGAYGAGVSYAGGIGAATSIGGLGAATPIGGFGTATPIGGFGLPAPAPYHTYGPTHSVPVHGTAYQAPDVYSSPSHDEHIGSEIDFSGSFPSYDPEPAFEEAPHRDISYNEPQVVKHFHTHTHIHKGQIGGIPIGPYGKDISYSGSQHSEDLDSRPIRSHTLPVVEPHSAVINSLRRGDCECVPRNFCPPSEIVGRSGRRLALDARNSPSDILSTASKDNQGAASENNEVVVDPKETPKKKTKREVKTSFKVFNGTEPVSNNLFVS